MNTFIETKGEISQENEVFMANCMVTIPRTTMSVYSYVVDGVLIDTGSQSLRNEFSIFFEICDFDQVVLTHFHEDHTGNAALIQQQYKVPIYIHPMSTHLTEQPLRIPVYRKQIWGDVEPFTSQQLGKTFQSRNDTWEVIETPGHAKDHVAFYNQSKGILFTGDLFITPKVKLVLVDENILSTLDSLKKVLTYDFEQMYCSHAGLVKNPKAMIQLKIDYIEEVEGKALALAKEGKDVYEVTAELFPKNYPLIAASNSEWSAVHMVRAFLNRG
ncbi:MBL fold metallo-hydrolase [Sporosarcina pasteurii]|uniref:Predicted metal-dependent RNase, consists of a metallo-beta-lactamase domain and an RNA-binding KH domain n=1 Tax=Sporosarcina pasteurii TaxID=1474 RepID=A0A380BVY4_SPOPA|nr:MBL fold metallo-hydrolase [Sporosarcina pasteurii]MDS9471378.1 MBL fold metallo-hydrolase [Sporosarcina pasteurii]QBQ04994.1 MBL fold metallo-hydrolase [Sporosarcina pasteurii]SUJ08220.1 Predicted metal-dependent RNase, consists of a metallo-beta-lactamase domain and an RNA-binding KH domain [Sporosarcina pasteurii]